jgi:ATP synthase protein I
MWRDALRHAGVGWEIVVALVVGYLLGWWFDRTLGTSPVLKIVGVLLGLGAGVLALLRVIGEYRREVGPDEPADENAPPLPLRRRRHHRRRPRPDAPEGNPGAGGASERKR